MTKKIAYCGLFTALALIFSYVEVLIPFNFGVPGIKLGLANIVLVVALYKMKTSYVYIIMLLKVFLTGLLFGNIMSIAFSLAGGVLSLGIMTLLRKVPSFGIMGVSIGGAVCHNIGQLAVACFVVSSFAVSYYLPVLLLGGVATGAVIGLVSGAMINKLETVKIDD